MGEKKGKVLKENAAAARDLAAQLAADKKFRMQLLRAADHSVRAKRHARRHRLGLVAAATRFATDRQLRADASRITRDLRGAWTRVEKKRSHRLRNSILLLGSAAGVAAVVVPRSRGWIAGRLGGLGIGDGYRPRTIEAAIEVDAPVSTVYNQWTQFEEFPEFMEGVEAVRQLDDTRLHWVATIAGNRAEWDAKILEQHPDRQISWISEDGKKTRGTVSFEPLGPSRTLVRLSMSYQAEGTREAIGSAAGLDSRRVERDLESFKQLLETRGTESGAWQGEISAGKAH
jgi:uncharacterized membrane protein